MLQRFIIMTMKTGDNAGKKMVRWAPSEFCQMMPATAYPTCKLEINSVC
jgi:hypothetical protein